jgi:hypothetical protein
MPLKRVVPRGEPGREGGIFLSVFLILSGAAPVVEHSAPYDEHAWDYDISEQSGIR